MVEMLLLRVWPWKRGDLNRFLPLPVRDFDLLDEMALSQIPLPSMIPLAMARSITSLGGVGGLSG